MLDHHYSRFLSLLQKFPEQISTSLSLMKNFSIPIQASDIQHIVISGMGGSAISGDLLLGYAGEQLSLPVYINRDYSVPKYVNQHTLFIALSYSGDTEETLTATREALSRSAKVVVISSGGEMKTFCLQNNCPFVEIPTGYPPRQALGYLFIPLLKILETIGCIQVPQADYAESVALLKTMAERYHPDKSFGNNLANHIAQSIYHAIPICYAGAPYLYGVPIRWRNQFNENAKVLAFSNNFPELNHNEIMGYEGLYEVNKYFRVILLRDPDEHPRVQERIRITKRILKQQKILFGEVFAEGQSRLARLLSMVYTGDWASYYLALLNEKDPLAIDSINYLKQQLSEVNA